MYIIIESGSFLCERRSCTFTMHSLAPGKGLKVSPKVFKGQDDKVTNKLINNSLLLDISYKTTNLIILISFIRMQSCT